MNRFTVNGITDERDACDNCGRTNLKRTVCLHDHLTGEDVFFGTACAAKAKGVAVAEVKAEIKAARAAKEVARAKVFATRSEAWEAHLRAQLGAEFTTTAEAVRALGGFKAARAGFTWAE
jgi:hypothetical protein